MRSAVISFVFFGLLAGCGAVNGQRIDSGSFSELLAHLKTVTLNDLTAATARAEAGGDKIGAMCYPVIAKYVGKDNVAQEKLAGIFDAFEASRLAGKKITSADIPDDLRIACAPLFMDSRDLAIRIGAMVK